MKNWLVWNTCILVNSDKLTHVAYRATYFAPH